MYPSVSVLYFGRSAPSISLPYPFTSCPHYSTAFNMLACSVLPIMGLGASGCTIYVCVRALSHVFTMTKSPNHLSLLLGDTWLYTYCKSLTGWQTGILVAWKQTGSPLWPVTLHWVLPHPHGPWPGLDPLAPRRNLTVALSVIVPGVWCQQLLGGGLRCSVCSHSKRLSPALHSLPHWQKTDQNTLQIAFPALPSQQTAARQPGWSVGKHRSHPTK
jgi:hypothetical protein